MGVADAPTDERGYTAAAGTGFLWWPNLIEDVEETPELKWPHSVEVYDRMVREEAAVSSVLDAVRLPIQSTGWFLEPNGADSEVISFCAETFGLPVRGFDAAPPVRMRDRFVFASHLDIALDSLQYGHAVFEPVYRIVNGRAELRKLAERPPRTIEEWKVATDGGLDAIVQRASDTHKQVTIPIDRLAVYSRRKRGGAWIGKSILRTAYKPWLLKDMVLRVQAQVADRNGLGVPVYEAGPDPQGYEGEELKALQDAEIAEGLKLAAGLRSGEHSGASIRNGAKLDMKGVTGTLPDLDAQIRYYDEQISRSVLANFLNLGGEKSRGSFALGDTFQSFFIQSLQGDANRIRDTFNAYVIEDLVDINWGPEARAPRLVCDDIGSKHPVTAQAIYQLVQCGALMPDAALDEYLRTTYGLPASTGQPVGGAAPAQDSPTNTLRRTLARLQEQLRLLEESTEEDL